MLACALSMTANAWAGPKLKQIDLAGLKPGVTTRAQVQKLAARITLKEADRDAGRFVIGGYDLFCVSEYRNKVLAHFGCLTGHEYKSKDVAKGGKKASNVEVHQTLYQGLVKKFGKPDVDEMSEVRNGFGTRFMNHFVVWQDRIGNQLMMWAMSRQLDEGLLVMRSADLIKAEEEKKKAQERSRKF